MKLTSDRRASHLYCAPSSVQSACDASGKKSVTITANFEIQSDVIGFVKYILRRGLSVLGGLPAAARFITIVTVCVFRTKVTGRFGIVTGDFGNVTGRFGNVTEWTGRQDWRCA